MLCLRSPTVMIRMLDNFRGLYGPCSWHWGIASPIGVLRLLHENSYLWRVRVIIYKRLMTDHICRIHHMVEATTPKWTFEGSWERLHEKLWRYYDMKWRNKWSNSSTATSQAVPEKELKLSWCTLEIVTTSGALLIKWKWLKLWFEISTRPSRRSTC
jgi:hypothetical protein